MFSTRELIELAVKVEEDGEYLRSYVEGKIFPSLEEMWNKVKDKDILDVIDYAINLEKDTIISIMKLGKG